MKNKKQPNEANPPKLVVLKGSVYSLPVLYYINELTIPGDIRSCYTTSINQYALDFICRKQSQLNGMGLLIFREIVHPQDLSQLRLSLTTIYPPGSDRTIITTIRLKPFGQTKYKLFQCSKLVLETFGDGTVKKIMVCASDITHLQSADLSKAPASASPQIIQFRHMFLCLTNREKEILQLIANRVSTSEIAARLFISFETVKKHRSNLLQKTGVKRMDNLVSIAIKCWEF